MAPTSSPTDARDAHRFFDIVEALADESRRDIVADIVAHPKGSPSMKELVFTTGLHRTTIYQHLDVLIDAGIVEVVEVPVGERRKGQQSKFYRLTKMAREVFNRNNVFSPERYQEIYAGVVKPDEIKQAEAVPRPDLDSSVED